MVKTQLAPGTEVILVTFKGVQFVQQASTETTVGDSFFSETDGDVTDGCSVERVTVDGHVILTTDAGNILSDNNNNIYEQVDHVVIESDTFIGTRKPPIGH